MDDQSKYLVDNEPPYNADLSTYLVPPEQKLQWLLRYTYKLQRNYDLKADELDHLYELYYDLKKKEFRTAELNQRVIDQNKTIKQMNEQINQLTLKLLTKK